MKRFSLQNAAGKKIALFGLVFFLILFSPSLTRRGLGGGHVLAAPRKGYEAQLQKLASSITLAPGETKTVDIAYKNIGKEVWTNSGDGYVSLYTFDAKNRKSIFADASWIDETHPTKMKESSIAKNKIGHFELTLHAPEKVGTYKESFSIVSEDTTWIPGGDIKLSIEVKSAARKGYEAYLVNQPDAISMAPSATQTIELAYKNIGKTTWKNTGDSFVSLYTFDKKDRKSVFADKTWLTAAHPVKLREKSVAPGAVGHFELVLTAPKKTGSYVESFDLVSENVTWIPGAPVKLTIEVAKTAIPVAQTSKTRLASDIGQPGLSAFVLLRSEKRVNAEGGEQVVYKVGMRNTGTVPWIKREVRSADTMSMATGSNSPVTQLALNSTGVVDPGAIDFLSFAFTAPSTKGTYTMKYQFAANDTVLPDAEIDIPVDVTSDAGDLLNSPIVNNIETQNLIDEPIVRIGILIVDDETANQVKISCNTDWKLIDGNGNILGEKLANDPILAFYKNAIYYFDKGDGLEQSVSYLRFVPNAPGSVCKIENFDKRVTRHAGYAENTYRNILELRYNSTKDRTWVINELPMEDYLAGLGETSELSEYQFKKTLITIARTFALYQWERATKHASEFFHMNSSADDQVYRGYEYEMGNPSIGQAARETRGVTVTYAGKTAITPYFSRSDGRTRDWHEVWGGTVAWAKSVPCPCDAANNRTLWGHGVGLSASEALCMAKNGQQWDAILKYFYQGIDLSKRWN
ncbi:MAG: hypothetical protein NTX72_00160 [Candidatus Uhrbacteria bacterium]|nr:hypothetical protein [Candidatus Uhrbacteria bacterium]